MRLLAEVASLGRKMVWSRRGEGSTFRAQTLSSTGGPRSAKRLAERTDRTILIRTAVVAAVFLVIS